MIQLDCSAPVTHVQLCGIVEWDFRKCEGFLFGGRAGGWLFRNHVRKGGAAHREVSARAAVAYGGRIS